jgi:DNA-binding CsgD family transcriptional regulator
MLETWHIEAASGAQPVPAKSVGLLLEAGCDAEPGSRMLAFLDQVVPVGYLSLVEYVTPTRRGVAVPQLVEGHAASNVPNVTAACFAHYRQHFWREDRATHIAQQMDRTGQALLTGLHFQAGDIHVPSWRTEIYERAQLADRLSFLYSPLPGSIYAINLYRHNAHGGFRPAEIERLLAVAPLLRQVHRLSLRHACTGEQARERRLEQAERLLRQRLPELSPRERTVCARIACGISADGIAADLDVAPSTVVTLRKRAYAKLAARGLGPGRRQLAELLHQPF